MKFQKLFDTLQKVKDLGKKLRFRLTYLFWGSRPRNHKFTLQTKRSLKQHLREDDEQLGKPTKPWGQNVVSLYKLK